VPAKSPEEPWGSGGVEEGRPALRAGKRALAAALAVSLLFAMVAGLLWWTRNSPYRGRLVARTASVEVTREGRTASLRTLELLELRAGDLVRTPSEGGADFGWASGAEAYLRGGSEVVIGSGPAELELRRGSLRVVPGRAGAVSVIRAGRRYLIRGEEIDLSPEGARAPIGPVEIEWERGTSRIEPGATRPWPGP
jgi:hypothetical protein